LKAPEEFSSPENPRAPMRSFPFQLPAGPSELRVAEHAVDVAVGHRGVRCSSTSIFACARALVAKAAIATAGRCRKKRTIYTGDPEPMTGHGVLPG